MIGKKNLEIQVGLFVLLGVGLFMVAVLLLGGNNPFWSTERRYVVYYNEVSGLIPGAKVVLNGIRVGAIGSIDFDIEKNSIRMRLDVNSKYANLVRKDTTATIATQGVLGDKFINLKAGTQTEPEVPDGGELQTGTGTDLSGLLTSSETLITNLNSAVRTLDTILKNLERKDRSNRIFEGFAQTSENLSVVTDKLKTTADTLNSVLKKVDGGKGTLGALVNDPELYDDVKKLLGGVSRNRVLRNVIRQSVKDSEAKDAEEPVKN